MKEDEIGEEVAEDADEENGDEVEDEARLDHVSDSDFAGGEDDGVGRCAGGHHEAAGAGDGGGDEEEGDGDVEAEGDGVQDGEHGGGGGGVAGEFADEDEQGAGDGDEDDGVDAFHGGDELTDRAAHACGLHCGCEGEAAAEEEEDAPGEFAHVMPGEEASADGCAGRDEEAGKGGEDGDAGVGEAGEREGG